MTVILSYNSLSVTFVFLYVYLASIRATQFTVTDPQWITSSYFRANNQPVLNTLTGSDQTPRYTFTFSSALQEIPNLAYGIKGYKGDDYLMPQFFEIRRQGLTASNFSVAIQIFGKTNVWILNVAYLAIDINFPHHLNSFDNVPLNYSQGDLVNISVNSSIKTEYTNVINYTQQAASMTYKTFNSPLSSNKILLFIISLFIYADFRSGDVLNPVNITIQQEVLSETTYYLKAYIFKNAKISRLHFSQIIFNYLDVQSSHKYLLVYDIWTTDKNGGFMQIPSAFVDNFIMGLKDFRTIDGRCGINYKWQFQVASGKYGVKLYQSNFSHVSGSADGCSLDQITSTVFYMKTWECPSTHPYFNLTSNKCQDKCGDRYFENITQSYCQPCHYTCLTCYDDANTNCKNCADNDNRIFQNNDSCPCKQGYYDNEVDSICLLCPTITNCLYCYFNSSYLANDTTNSIEFGCLTCLSGYYPSQTSGQCILNVCGDQVLSDEEQCDDGNTISGDGCSSTCTIEPFWTCPIYYCCYLFPKAIELQLITYIKQLKSNEFKIQGLLKTSFAYFDFYQDKVIKPLKIQTAPVSGHATSFQYDQISKKFDIDLVYNQSLTFPFEVIIFLQIPIPRSDCKNNSFEAKLNIDVRPSNNLPPVFYSAQQYQTSQQISNFMFGMMIFSWIIMLWSIFIGKVIGLELMGVFQLAFLDLANHNDLNLMLTGLLKLNFINGLNINYLLNLDPQQSLPASIKQLDYSSSLLYNFNAMLLFHIFSTIIGSIFYLIIHKYSLSNSNRITFFLKGFIKQTLVTITMFNCLNLAFAVGLNFKYGGNQSSSLLALDSMFIIIEIVIFIGIIVILLNGSTQLGQFVKQFKRIKFCQSYVAITMIYRVVLGFYIAYTNQHQVHTLLILSLVIFYLIYHFAHLPFISSIHNYRSSICHLGFCGILFVTMYYRSLKSTTDIQIKSKIFSPAYIELTLLLICQIVSIVSLLIETFYRLKPLSLVKTDQNQNLAHSQMKIQNQTTIIRQEQNLPQVDHLGFVTLQ